MNRKTVFGLAAAVGSVVLLCGAADEKEKADKPEKAAKASGADFTESFFEDKSDLVSTGKNPYFSLEPGTVNEYEGKEDGEEATLKITVLDETKEVDGVKCRIVEERETSKGKLSEISRNYFAISKRTNNVYYFGEDSKAYKDEKPVGDEGSWEAGKDGAKYGLMMPGCVLLGSRYYQEIAPGKAMDRAEHVSISEKMKVPAGEFDNVLKTDESTPLEKGHENKFYAPGVGLIKDGDLVLVKSSGGEKKK